MGPDGHTILNYRPVERTKLAAGASRRRKVATVRLAAAMAVVAAALSAGQASARAAAPLPAKCSSARLHFTGNGSKDIAPLNVRHNSTLYWQARGGYFFLANRLDASSGKDTLNVMSSARRGTTYTPAGRYQIAVGAVGAWTICILPG